MQTNKSKSLRSIRVKLERELSSLNREIEEKEKQLDSFQKITISTSVNICDITKEELAKEILKGSKLYSNWEHEIYFTKEEDETEEQSRARRHDLICNIEELKKKRTILRNELNEVISMQEENKEKYKNPEYIAYLKLKSKFENE